MRMRMRMRMNKLLISDDTHTHTRARPSKLRLEWNGMESMNETKRNVLKLWMEPVGE